MPLIDSIPLYDRPAIQPAASAPTGILAGAWRDLRYVFAVLPLSIVAFAIWVAGLSVTLSVAVLAVGALAWLGTVALVRVAAGWDRQLVGWYRGAPLTVRYRPTPTTGLLATLKTVTRDPQTWRDLRWVVVNSTYGFVLATVAVTVTGLTLAELSAPAWWWAIPNPSQQYATLNLGVYTVNSTGWALVSAGLGVVLLPVAAAVNRAVARSHARLAARMLSPRS
jgi:hypothetical protein